MRPSGVTYGKKIGGVCLEQGSKEGLPKVFGSREWVSDAKVTGQINAPAN